MTKIRHCDNDREWKVLGGMDSEDSVSTGMGVVTHAGVGGCGFESRLSMVSDRHLSKQAIWPLFCLATATGFSQPRQAHISQKEVFFLSSWNLPKLLAILGLLCASSIGARAAPIGGNNPEDTPTNELHWFYPRQVSSNAWIPAAAISAFLSVLIIITFWKRRATLLSCIRNHVSRGTLNSGAVRTELTAEQLAGSVNNDGTNRGNTTTSRPRRSRRPRRTPSQMSTHSLPAYAKEPGEQELVILRGSQDTEDAPISQPLPVIVSLDEDIEDSADGHQQPRYTPIPSTSADTPLLEQDLADDLSGHSSGNSSHRRVESIETGNNSSDTTSLTRVESHDIEPTPDPRGEAPPYFEVVEQPGNGGVIPRRGFINAGPHNTPASPVPPTDAVPSASLSPQGSSQPRSGFRSLFNRMSVSYASSHTRNDSSTSAVSSPSHSHSHTRGTSATSILSHFRSLSRQKSIASHNSSHANLTSPSLISLNSISAPLTHTVVRTEFAYPRSGPTPEQMRLITSRESLARFGVPYGPDALAFASMSRVDLDYGERPPQFEEVVGTGNGSDRAGDSNASTTAESVTRGDGENIQIQVSEADEVSRNDNAPRSTPPDGLSVEQGSDPLSFEGVQGTSGTLVLNGVVESEKGEKDDEEKKEAVGKGKAKEVVKPESTISPVPQAQHAAPDGSLIVEEGSSEPTRASINLAAVPASPEAPEAGSTSVQSTSATSTSASASSLASESPVPASDSLLPSGPPTTPATSTTSATSPSSHDPTSEPVLHPQNGTTLRRSESHASQLSYTSRMSYTSNITYRTAAESLSSRKGIRRPSALEGGDDEGEANQVKDDDIDTAENERASTPTLGGKLKMTHEKESTDATITAHMLITTPGGTKATQEGHTSSAAISVP